MTVPPAAIPGDLLEQRVRDIVARHRDDRGALLPILHTLQVELGCVSAEVIPLVASELNISRADVHGVVSFYRDFRSEPAGRAEVRLCRGEACQAVGANELVEHAQRRLGVGIGQTTHDAAVTLGEVFCLGNCALGPAVQVDGRLVGRVTPDRLDALLAPLTGTVPSEEHA